MSLVGRMEGEREKKRKRGRKRRVCCRLEEVANSDGLKK